MTRFGRFRGILTCCCWGLLCLGAAGAQTANDLKLKISIPESGFVSPQQYTNAFFGFTLPLPAGHHFQSEDLSLSDRALQHFLFAEKSFDKGLSILVVSATQVLGSPQDEAQKLVFLPGGQGKDGPEALSIGGRLFWKSQVEQNTLGGKIYRARYTTGAAGFVLQFSISSYSGRLLDELKQNVESIRFFDPARVREIAGAGSHPFLPQAARVRLESEPEVDLARLDPGHISSNMYSNPSLGFSFEFPDRWTVHDGRAGNESLGVLASLKTSTPTSPTSSPQCIRTLFSATKFPPDTVSPEFNSRIALLAADPACFVSDVKFPSSVHDPDLKFFGNAIVRAFAGGPLIGQDASSIRAVDLGGHIFLEVPSVSAVPVSGSTLLRKVHKSFVLADMQQYWVIWLFECDSESELSQLMKGSVSFEPVSASSR